MVSVTAAEYAVRRTASSGVECGSVVSYHSGEPLRSGRVGEVHQ